MKPSDASGSEEHDWATQVLPWSVNGSLDDADAARFRVHLKICAECRRDLRSEQALARRMATGPVVDYAPQASFSRLMQQVDRDLQRTQSAPFPPQRAPRVEPRRRSRFALAMALQAAAVAALAVSVGWLFLRPAEAPQYRTLSSAPATANAQLQVVFADMATAADIRATLAKVGGHIVEGPSVAGVFLVSLESRDAAGAPLDYDVTAALDLLREDRDIRYVAALPEPVSP